MTSQWNTILCCLVIMLFTTPKVEADAVSWNYDSSDKGPEKWHLNYPDCGGSMQSPININTGGILYDPNLNKFSFSSYNDAENVHMKLINKGGHTAEVDFEGEPIYIGEGNLPGEYRLDQLHFHWGKESDRGSEHTVDDRHFPLEMHIVHHMEKLGNISKAMSHPYGLAVIGFFFESTDQNNVNFDKILQYFDNITEPNQHIDIEPFPVTDLIPKWKNMDYYRYYGSLTTPPCSETVIWSIATEPIKISESQLNKFRALRGDHNNPLVDDFRPLQKLRSRTVTTTLGLQQKCQTNDSWRSSLSLTSLISSLLVVFWFN